MNVQIRWMIRRDMPEVLSIEQESFDIPWDEDDFVAALRHRTCVGMVAETQTDWGEEIAGFVLYELEPHRLRLINFAVAEKYRREGVGRAMVERLREKLSQKRRKAIVLAIPETNLGGQLFFKAVGFQCVNIQRRHYVKTDEDAYVFSSSAAESVEARI